MYIVAGLGNPGIKYLKTPHNAGFVAVELFAEKYGVEFNKKGFKGIYGEKTIGKEKVIFLKPQTFMNLSGECIREITSYFKVPTENLLVIYDDVDIPLGDIRVRPKGSAGTHNGMRNIVSLLGTTDFPRVRIGTKPNGEVVLLDYVLNDIAEEDMEAYSRSVKAAAACAEAFVLGDDMDKLMRDFNGPRK